MLPSSSNFVRPGQPFFSATSERGPGSSGQASSVSGMLSLSTSTSGQPSSSWMPSLSSGSSGQRSSESKMPSLSVSGGAGQPSVLCGGRPSSLMVGHLSTSSG